MPKRNNIVCANAVTKNDLIELRLKEKVKNRMLGIETNGMKVKNLVLEEIVDTLLDANEVMLMSIEKELVDIRKGLENLTTVLADAMKQPASNSELVREMLLQVAANLASRPDPIPSRAEEKPARNREKQPLPEVDYQRKIKVFNLLKEAEDKHGTLTHYREAHSAIPRLSYYIYGKHRIWSAWEHFRVEYENWLRQESM